MTETLRKPFPFPKFQTDDDFVGRRDQEKTGYTQPTHLSQSQDPWNRLSSGHTLSSARHQVFHFDPQAPNDELDFLLKTEYNQHRDLFKTKSEAFVQAETLDLDHGRVLKNRMHVIPKTVPSLNHPLKVWASGKKDNLNSVKNAIEGIHSQATNKGYSRKPDGGFFTS